MNKDSKQDVPEGWTQTTDSVWFHRERRIVVAVHDMDGKCNIVASKGYSYESGYETIRLDDSDMLLVRALASSLMPQYNAYAFTDEHLGNLRLLREL